jgi:hypothetical protein
MVVAGRIERFRLEDTPDCNKPSSPYGHKGPARLARVEALPVQEANFEPA